MSGSQRVGRAACAAAGAPVGSAGEQGSGTVTVLGTCALGVAMVLAVAALGQASAAGAQAAGAADLAALAASDARRGLSPQEPCDLARQTAERNAAALLECTAGADGSMRIEVELSRGPLPAARAAAVAGAPAPRTP